MAVFLSSRRGHRSALMQIALEVFLSVLGPPPTCVGVQMLRCLWGNFISSGFITLSFFLTDFLSQRPEHWITTVRD